jgi:1-deoxy-D-xylulose-5-phosphate synthase
MIQGKTTLLPTIQGPADVKKLSPAQLPQLAQEIRELLIEVTSKNGGHVGPNLGITELTIALHRVFNTPEDSFIFDVSHQGYVHKLLTGRQGEKFAKIRQTGGYSGFLSREESPHDAFGAGHAGTALSAAIGIAAGRDRLGGNEHVLALLGDAGLTCGITLEALNNAASSAKRLIIILNDNEWSISRNVGAIAKYLNEIITAPFYKRFHQDAEAFLNKIPGGKQCIRLISKIKKEIKDLFVPSSLFEKFNIRYLGPINGHDFNELEKYLNFCKQSPEPILLHVLTTKGKGYDIALKNPEKFHGTGAFNPCTGESIGASKSIPNYQDIVGDALVRFAKEDKRVIGITAAMPSGTGLTRLSKEVPEQFLDVGIAEEHAVVCAAGMAVKGMKPVCAIYSTFLQRAFDPIMHDVCLQNLPVLFCMDRAGLSPNDGPTHHGLFDLAYLRCIPRTVIMQPKDEDELVDMMHTGLNCDQPTFIRYPRGTAVGVTIKPEPTILPLGKAEVIHPGSDIILWSLGSMLPEAQQLADRLAKEQNITAGIINARFVKPLDTELIAQQVRNGTKLFVTLEDHVLSGGFGSAFLETLEDMNAQTPVVRIGWPDTFITHGNSAKILRDTYGLSTEKMYLNILEKWQSISIALNSDKSYTKSH